MRRRLVDLVVGELRGPAGGEEELLPPGRRPQDRYLVGALAPHGVEIEPEADEDLVSGVDDIEETAPAEQSAARSFVPSSFGMSFRVRGDCARLVVEASWGRYESIPNPDGEGRVWQRVPCRGSVELPLDPGADDQRLVPVAEQPDVRVQALVRRVGETLSVTLFLRNDQAVPESRRDAAWLFQAELRVRGADGDDPFVAADGAPDGDEPAEDRALALAYRRRREQAVGHGVAVHEEVDPSDASRVRAIRTSAVPAHEVPMTDPEGDRARLGAAERDMAVLAAAADGELPAMLMPLVDGYADWIADQRRRLAEGADDLAGHADAAEAALADAERARARIAAGIDLLRRDTAARDAFRFANRAMAMQRAHALWAEHRRRGGTRPLSDFETPEQRTWRPFQLAFVLLNLPALTDPLHKERSHPTEAICDLLWFPTGGGKTEAYLGLAAYTMALRRLQGPLGGRSPSGVAVLMRYTLRVLTLQQFQRAAALVCACEVLRRTDPERYGEEPFRIGLWVGQATTPNTVDQAAEALRNQHGDGYVRTGGGRPDQLSHCPWCGEAIVAGRDMRAETYERGRARVLTFCSDPRGLCDFTPAIAPDEGIPVMTVDEEIYRRLPAMLIATVDKLAQLPWNPATQALFGTVDGRCERHGYRATGLTEADSHPVKGSLPRARTVDRGVLLRPPDLVIQDELHLISGPLGTLVGLYETAVDGLATWELDGRPVRPKVVASTATVRRAREQIHALFLRDVAVFPPPGLDVEDSFFARELPIGDDAPGRLYLGVCAPGRRLKAAAIRVYVALLSSAQKLYEEYGAAADAWMTLVGYFGSIRELAGMRRACEDDVRTRLQRMDAHGLPRRSIGAAATSIEELTSRLAATDIPVLLDAMERRFDPAHDAARRARNRDAPARPIDVLLATSMISVGVDVQRLGLMVVAGQPKTTAEYIQATSRVGRRTPGLVVTVYNWARPRDLSHYTRFAHYHRSFYRHVEPLSVTPFSPRALDRGLSALLVALLRLSGLELAPNAAAALLERDSEQTRAVVAAIVERAGAVVPTGPTADEVSRHLAQRLDRWRAEADRLAREGSRLGYRDGGDSRIVGLLSAPGPGPWTRFTALNSLRDVEPTAGLVLRDESLWSGGGPGSDRGAAS
ncbi:MAG: DISARM system helicase DrmA [Thermoleophilia bacterium]